MQISSIGQKQNLLKLGFYILWLLSVFWLSKELFRIMLGTNTQGDSCYSTHWEIGNIYNWIDGTPCIFTTEFLFSAYYSYAVLYCLCDYVRRRIIKVNPSVIWRLCEITVLFLFYWTHIIYSPINPTIIYTSLLGSLQLFGPIFVMVATTKFIPLKSMPWLTGGLIILPCVAWLIF